MDEWLEILIFVIVIIANIVGGIVKAKKKLQKKNLEQPPVNNDDEYYEENFEEEYFSKEDFQDVIPAAVSADGNIPFPETTAANAPCPDCPPCKNDAVSTVNMLEVIDNDEDENFDYGEFMRTHGKEAFVLAEIILPANSRQGS